MNQRKGKSNKRQSKKEFETISLQALFICLCVCVYACAISSLVLLTSNTRLFVSPIVIQKTILHQPLASHLGIHLDNDRTQTFNSILLLFSQESTQLRRQIYQANGHNQIKIIRDQFTKNIASHPINPIRLYGAITVKYVGKMLLYTKTIIFWVKSLQIIAKLFLNGVFSYCLLLLC